MNPVFTPLLRLAAATALVVPSLAWGQGRFDSAIPFQFLETSPWTVSAGARYSTEGAGVKFGKLGNISVGATLAPLSDGAVNRVYHNGLVTVDGVRPNETDAAGVRFSVPGQRYAGRRTDTAGNEFFVGDFLAYTPGQTRSWSINSGSQVAGDRVGMSLYSVESSGATALANGDASGGVEISVGRRLRRFGKKVEFGVTGTFGINDINARTTGSVQANLVALTDFYRLYGTAPTGAYNGPKFADLLNAEGGLVLTNGLETTTPLDQVPVERRSITTANAATITGSWKINGAYYIVRMGPTVRVFITNRLAFSFDAGLATAIVGSAFEVRETVELPDVANPISTTERAEKSALLTGFYGSGTMEYWMTDRTNAHAGAAYEALGNYQQSVGGRDADIDIGSTITVRLGLTTRF